MKLDSKCTDAYCMQCRWHDPSAANTGRGAAHARNEAGPAAAGPLLDQSPSGT